tara:strand:- start:1705 stop:2532 length:828 start_codon:yes stop_codon:yes gene_type:complete
MKIPRLRTILLAPLVLFAVFYLGIAVLLLFKSEPIAALAGTPADYSNVAIFGASGTAGDGILKAAMRNPDIETIHVVTRRATPRIEVGVATGKVQMHLHMDYLDYASVGEKLVDTDAVYWAIGTSAVGVDEETYGRIHVDFPLRFVQEWLATSATDDISFHYISSSDISEDSSMMWAREKLRAEKALFKAAQGTKLRVIAYRPDYIGPTDEEAHVGQRLLYWFFAPVGAAVRATQIGEAMFEVTARGAEFENGDRLGTWSIRRHSDAFKQRRSAD